MTAARRAETAEAAPAGLGMRAALEALARQDAAHAIRPALVELLRAVPGAPSVADLDRVLGARAGVRFERQAPGRAGRRGGWVEVGELYDAVIATRGVVPSREGSLHDVLNALVWASFPRSKRTLHARQHAILRTHLPARPERLPNARPRQADVLAMFDEGGLVLTASAQVAPRLEEALQSANHAAIAADVAAGTVGAWVFGHAVLEHLAEARPVEPRASAYSIATVLPRSATDLDLAIEARLRDPAEFRAPPAWAAVPVRAIFPDLPVRSPFVR